MDHQTSLIGMIVASICLAFGLGILAHASVWQTEAKRFRRENE